MMEQNDLTPEFFSLFFGESVYKIDDLPKGHEPTNEAESSAPSQQEEHPYHLHEGNGDLIVVAQITDGKPLPEDQKLLLSKILKAVGHDLDDNSILTIDHKLPPEIDLSKYPYNLFFVKNPANFIDHLPGKFYEIRTFEKHMSMASHELSILMRNEDYKRALWAMLQKVFRP